MVHVSSRRGRMLWYDGSVPQIMTFFFVHFDSGPRFSFRNGQHVLADLLNENGFFLRGM